MSQSQTIDPPPPTTTSATSTTSSLWKKDSYNDNSGPLWQWRLMTERLWVRILLPTSLSSKNLLLKVVLCRAFKEIIEWRRKNFCFTSAQKGVTDLNKRRKGTKMTNILNGLIRFYFEYRSVTMDTQLSISFYRVRSNVLICSISVTYRLNN